MINIGAAVRSLLVALTLAGAVASAVRPARAEGRRPDFELAVGMGVSRDSIGFIPERTETLPAFFMMGGFGSGPVGVDVAAYAISAVGRFPSSDRPLDRQGVELLAIVRPVAFAIPRGPRWSARLLRSISIAGGPAWEHVTSGKPADSRAGFRIGGHLDVPLQAAARSGELRLRLGVRRLFGFSAPALPPPTKQAGDTKGEVFAALALVF